MHPHSHGCKPAGMWFRIVPVFREVVSSWIYLFGVEGSDEGVVHFFDYRRVEFDPIAPAAIPAQLGYKTDCVHGDTAAIRRWFDCGLHNEATLAAAINECANRKSFRWPDFGESHVHVFIDMGRILPHTGCVEQVFFIGSPCT
jgi:hypothetical protein